MAGVGRPCYCVAGPDLTIKSQRTSAARPYDHQPFTDPRPYRPRKVELSNLDPLSSVRLNRTGFDSGYMGWAAASVRRVWLGS